MKRLTSFGFPSTKTGKGERPTWEVSVKRLNKTIILCQDKYEAQKLSNFIFNKDGKDTFISEILNVVGNEIIVSLKDKSAHSIIVKDNQEVETFIDFIQSVIEKEHKILDAKILENSVEIHKG